MKKQIIASLAALIATPLVWLQPALADELLGDAADLLTVEDGLVSDLDEPTGLAFLPDGRMLITLRAGELIVVSADGQTQASAGTVEVDSGGGEQGLLNVAVHPDYATNHIIFLYYIGNGNKEGARVVSVELGDDGQLDLATEKAFVEGISAPANHVGGGLSVNGDYLYIGTGDSGSNSGALPYAQSVRNYYPTCLTNLNGKVLRLNLDGTIPTDNPLVGKMVTACGNSPGTAPTGMGAARGEIFAWGFRNAFRVWGDPVSNNVWVGHVGEVTFEMIDVVPPTGNKHFGWPFQEGGVGFPDDECTKYEPDVGDCTKPVYSCEQSDGQNGSIPSGAPCDAWGNECDDPDVPNDCDSITGGVILTGCEWPASLRGQYVFGDYSSENIWTLPVNEARDNVIGERVPFAVTNSGPVAFAERDGALYILSYSGSGKLSKITPKMSNADCEPAPGPSMMTDAGPAPSDTMAPPVGSEVPAPSTTTSSAPAPSTSGAAPSPSTASSTAPPSMSSTPTGSAAVPPAASSAPVAGTSSPAPSTLIDRDGLDDTGKAASCGCEVVGVRTNRLGAFAMLGLAAAWFTRRRRIG